MKKSRGTQRLTSIRKWKQILLGGFLISLLPFLVWAAINQRLELRKRAASGEPGIHPINWITPTVNLSADNFYIYANGQYFWGNDPQITVRSDPGTPAYTTLEVTWHENLYNGIPVEMRLYVYFHSDGTRWWADEIRTYNGVSPGDWVYYFGHFFDAPLGTAISGQMDIASSQGQQYTGRLHFSNFRVQAFSYVGPTPTTVQAACLGKPDGTPCTPYSCPVCQPNEPCPLIYCDPSPGMCLSQQCKRIIIPTQTGCIASPAYTGDLCNGYRLIDYLPSNAACYGTLEQCLPNQGSGTCVHSPVVAGDLCQGWRVMGGIRRGCYTWEQCQALRVTPTPSVSVTPTPYTSITPTPYSSMTPTPYTSVTPVPYPPGDVNRNGRVDWYDLALLISSFGHNYPNADWNGNGYVDIFDYTTIVRSYGLGGPVWVSPTPVSGTCLVGGCSGEICVDSATGNVSTPCVYREEYSCLQYSRCERQPNGTCGWTPTDGYTQCRNGLGITGQ